MFGKKDKRYNNYNDNYTNRYAQTAYLGLVMAVVIGIGYGIYKLIEWLFL